MNTWILFLLGAYLGVAFVWVRRAERGFRAAGMVIRWRVAMIIVALSLFWPFFLRVRISPGE